MAPTYVVNTGGFVAGAAANSNKVAVQLATGAQVENRIVGISVSFNGNNSATKPVEVEIVKYTSASSGGAAFTPLKKNAVANAQTTARTNDTTEGGSPTLYEHYGIPGTSGVIYQLPLGREFRMGVSEFLAVRIRWQTAETPTFYSVNVEFEE